MKNEHINLKIWNSEKSPPTICPCRKFFPSHPQFFIDIFQKNVNITVKKVMKTETKWEKHDVVNQNDECLLVLFGLFIECTQICVLQENLKACRKTCRQQDAISELLFKTAFLLKNDKQFMKFTIKKITLHLFNLVSAFVSTFLQVYK